MSGLTNQDKADIAMALIGRCDADGITVPLLADGITEAVIAIRERAVNEALTEAADAIFEYACGWSREPLARTAAKGAAAIVRAHTT